LSTCVRKPTRIVSSDQCCRVRNPLVYELNGSAGVRLLWLPVSCLSNKYVNFLTQTIACHSVSASAEFFCYSIIRCRWLDLEVMLWDTSAPLHQLLCSQEGCKVCLLTYLRNRTTELHQIFNSAMGDRLLVYYLSM